ncbi:hypothetical protein [Croceiramulus getboli]|nr:hypothetical protein P8624_09510 [Flavobacteriaceae bacterium YJPT1-3]
MESSTKSLSFYHSLGKLFYAIANADREVREEEYQRLQRYVSDYWTAIDDLEDVMGEDAAHLIKVVFEGSDYFQLSSEETYRDFVDFRTTFPEYFTPEIDRLIFKTARAIASSFSGMNKSELVLLGKLKLFLNLAD